MKRWWWIGLASVGTLVTGCGDDGDGDPGFDFSFAPTGPIQCGTLTCGADEICLESEPPTLLGDNPTSYACTRPPAGCDARRLCDCDLETFDGSPVRGCSILGERTLYLIDARCPERACSQAEACLLAYPQSGGIMPMRCVALPSGCAVGRDFCDGECAHDIAVAQGFEQNVGCYAGDWGVGVYVQL